MMCGTAQRHVTRHSGDAVTLTTTLMLLLLLLLLCVAMVTVAASEEDTQGKQQTGTRCFQDIY